MDENQFLELAEKYLKGEMTAEEAMHFEQLRSTNPELDQLVVSHALFLQSLGHYGEVRELKHQLHDIHQKLSDEGRIKSLELTSSAKVVNFWKRYRRTITIAASIAGITALCVNIMTWVIAPKTNDRRVQELVKTVDAIRNKQNQQDKKINHIANATKLPSDKSITGIGSAFIIDVKGFLVTNAHVVRNAKGAIVTNHEGAEFKANIVFTDDVRDIAILKIDDKDFDQVKHKMIPYGFRKQSSDIAESIFTIGYPDNKFVYGEGYLSSLTGHDGDTINCQVAVAANPGNSGGPVFNKNGEVIGMLSAREIQSEGVVYAIRTKYILQAIQELKESQPEFSNLKTSLTSSVRGTDKVQQVKRFRDYVYMLKVY
jgi:S1-C subfamily serine protease